MEKLSGPPIPATKIFQCGEGARYFGRALRCKPERLRVRCSLAPKRTIAQTQIASRSFPLERNSGMVQSRDTSSVTRRGAVAPLLGPIFLPEMFEGKGPHPRVKKNGPLSDSSRI